MSYRKYSARIILLLAFCESWLMSAMVPPTRIKGDVPDMDLYQKPDSRDFSPGQVSSGGVTEFSPHSPLPLTDSPLQLPEAAVFCPLPKKTVEQEYVNRWIGPQVRVIELGSPRNMLQGIRTIRPLNVSGQPTVAYLQRVLDEHMPELGPIELIEVSSDDAPALVYKVCTNTDGREDKRALLVLKVNPVLDDDDDTVAVSRKLALLQRGSVGRLGWKHELRKKFPFLPVITSVECFFSYTDQFGKKRIIEVLHPARGTSAYDILVRRTPLPHETLWECGVAVGRSLASFHRAMARAQATEVHGDFHLKNVFIESRFSSVLAVDILKRKTGIKQHIPLTDAADEMARRLVAKVGQPVAGSYTVSFIDNETMYHKKKHKQYIDWDINAFIMIPVLYWKFLYASDIQQSIWDSTIHFYKAFLTGYLSLMPETYYGYLREIIFAWLDTADAIIQEIDALAEGTPVTGDKTVLNGSLKADSDGDYWHVVDELYDRVWLHPEHKHFFEPQTNVLNEFIKQAVKHSELEEGLKNAQARLHELRRALLEILD